MRPTGRPRRHCSTWPRVCARIWLRSASCVQWVSPGFVRTELTDRNDFPMPFIIEADEAARSIIDGIESGRAEIVFPFRMAASMKLLRLLPHGLWTRIWKRQSSLRTK